MRGGVWFNRSLAIGAGLTLIIVVVDFVLLENNRSIQAEVNQRQQFINQSIQLSRIKETLIRDLANAAVNGKNEKLRDLLAQNGITINAPAGAPADAGNSPPPTANAPVGEVPAPGAPAAAPAQKAR